MQTSSLQPGAILNSPTQQYRIVEVLGAGSFGITYLATSKVKYGNVSFNVKFAIKEHFMDSCYRDKDGVRVHCTPTSRNSVEQSRNDFLKEAKRLQDLCNSSRNIVHVNEAFEANGTAYYVMEYLDGGSPGKMGEREALQYIQQIAAAVKILHEHKLLHLDIKPDNIVLKREDSGIIYPVLIDFGITKHFDEKGNPTSSPNAKGISQGYAPIEQNDVIKEFAPTLDIYALGATLLYLLTGKNPPSSVKMIDPTQRELKKLIPSSVSDATRNAILKAMNPNKNDRTQSVSSFLKDLGASQKEKGKHSEQKSDSEIFNDKRKTEPINNKKHKTKPLKKSLTDESQIHSKWNISYWITLISLFTAIAGLWLFDSDLFGTSILCLFGLVADFTVSHFVGKWLKKNSGLIFLITFLIFVMVCVFLHSMIPLYVVLAECVISLILIIVFTSEKNNLRWWASFAFLAFASFGGYVWYSYNVLHETNFGEKLSETDDINEDLSESNEVASEILNIDGHNCVDMGLSVYWATYNLGAGHFGGSPEVLGDFFAFGSLTPTDSTNVSAKDVRTMFKNISYLQKNDIIDSNYNLTRRYDAVTAQWGSQWRTPTIDELKELFSKCKREFGQIDGRNGVWLTGPSGATIFLPAQGYSPYKDGRDWNNKIAYYSSSTVYESNETQSYGICFTDSTYHVFCPKRNMALLIRPVSNK